MDRAKKSVSSSQKITEVTSVIAHQLKTPLSGIRSSLEVLLSGDLGQLTKDQREYLELTMGSTEKMIALVKNLLDASRIDEKRLQLDAKPTDLIRVAGDVVRDLYSFARAKNALLEFNIDGVVPPVYVDETKVREVLNNIIYNAIRYTKGRGTIVVSLKQDGASVLFSCKDTGIGIASGERKKIFSKFYRSPRVAALATDGSGLGLYISKAIIEKSGGKIWYESKVGKGTTFYFTLPIYKPNGIKKENSNNRRR